LSSRPTLFPIVGISASAGGLEAFSELLRALPVKTGMAFVLVQHLAPKYSSELREILSRTTKIPVAEVSDGSAVQPDHIYVIPPGTVMTIERGMLRLGARVLTRGQHLPIDHFLRSTPGARKRERQVAHDARASLQDLGQQDRGRSVKFSGYRRAEAES
jgi:two-component system CheB/CheR fusion protein